MTLLRCMICLKASGVLSITNKSRIGSWISTPCQGSPERKSLDAPSMIPNNDVTLCGSLVPHPQPVESTDDKKYCMLMPWHTGTTAVKMSLEDRMILIVLCRVIRHQKRSAIEKESPCALAPAYDAQGVRGVAEFGTGLGKVMRAAPRRAHERHRTTGSAEPNRTAGRRS